MVAQAGPPGVPRFVRPMLAVPGEPFDSADHFFEVKWDGFRAIAFLSGRTRLQSRNLKDLTALFPELQELHRVADKVVLDGEIVVPASGRPDFHLLQLRGRSGEAARARLAGRFPAVYVAFDLLFAGDRDCRNLPLESRREELARRVASGGGLVVQEVIVQTGIAFYRSCVARGLEGMVAKHRRSPYLSGRRSRYWVKAKAKREVDVVIGGYTLQGGRPGRLGALLVGAWSEDGENGDGGWSEGGALEYLGRVGTGWGDGEAADLLSTLEGLERDTPPFRRIARSESRGARWVHPAVVCTVRYLERTPDGRLRHPSFQGLRPDKDPGECVVHWPETTASRP